MRSFQYMHFLFSNAKHVSNLITQRFRYIIVIQAAALKPEDRNPGGNILSRLATKRRR